MNYKQKYLQALEQHNYNELLNIIFENFIENFDYKSLSDLGGFLSDIGHDGAKIELSEESCFSLGKKLVEYSYFSHPDVQNGFALQLICLEKDKDFETVCKMEPSATQLNNSLILNNIALSKYNLGFVNEAIEIQKSALGITGNLDNKRLIVKYNFILYKLFCNIDAKEELKCTDAILNMLISDDVFDFYSAMAFAAYTNRREFVEKHLEFFNATFLQADDLNQILKRYLTMGVKPNIEELKATLHPLTVYGDNFYLTL